MVLLLSLRIGVSSILIKKIQENTVQLIQKSPWIITGILSVGGMSFDLCSRFIEQGENGAPPWCTSVAKLTMAAYARARCTFSILAHWLQWTGFCHLHFSPVSLLDFKHTSTSWCNSIRLKVREQTLIVKNPRGNLHLARTLFLSTTTKKKSGFFTVVHLSKGCFVNVVYIFYSDT